MTIVREKYPIKEQTGWKWWVTSRPLTNKLIHRWLIFPHSFTSELVHTLIEEWDLDKRSRLLDPFVGAGTTLLAAKEKGISATGYDLSPLAVLASKVKLTNFNLRHLKASWGSLKSTIDTSKWNGTKKTYPDLIYKALPGKMLGTFESILTDIVNLRTYKAERDFFKLALLATIPEYSRAVSSGGWLKWVNKSNRSSGIMRDFSKQVNLMIEDVEDCGIHQQGKWCVKNSDVRALPDKENTYSAVITSPPYPNRHDYTRVFSVELMFGFLSWHDTRRLRYQSFQSHPESHPNRPRSNGYKEPIILSDVINRIQMKKHEVRIIEMLRGYFLDISCALSEIKRVCKNNAKIAFVVGNAQYYGEPIEVDKLTAEIGEQIGLSCEKIIVARYRGNSAQQMKMYGRIPSRESVVILRK
jgi:site-specific DNA-methyltransferase (cytosine-N4-specific)